MKRTTIVALTALPILLLGGFVLFISSIQPKPDPYYDQMPVGTAPELIQKYADAYYVAFDARDSYKSAAEKCNAEIEATKDLSSVYAEGFNAADDMVKQAAAAPIEESSALFAKARATKKEAEQTYQKWEAGNKACGQLVKEAQAAESAYSRALEELEHARDDYRLVISGGTTRRVMAVNNEEVEGFERDYVLSIKAKAEDNTELLAACDRYEAAFKGLAANHAETKIKEAAERAFGYTDYHALSAYDKLSKQVQKDASPELEAACRTAYAEWQAAKAIRTAHEEKYKNHIDDYIKLHKEYEEAFHLVLHLARPGK